MTTRTIPISHRPLVAAVALALGLGMGSAHAASILVADGGDSGTASTCTLRQAIESANTDAAVGTCTAGSGADNVSFDATLANSTITLGGSELKVTDDLTLSGSGQTIDAGGTSSVLALYSSLTASKLTITGGFSSGSGGGIAVGRNASLTLNNSTVAGNHADGYGGGIYGNKYANFNIANSTITGNHADASGGGIYAKYASVNVANSTITGNHADIDGGGMSIYDASATLILHNTILSGNTASSNADLYSDSASVTAQSSLLGSALSGSYAGNGNVFNDAPGLGALTNNGGPTPTMLPQWGSPVIDAGDNGLIPAGTTYDQRGAGFPRIVGPSVDIGAVEADAAAPLPEYVAVPSGSTWTGSLLAMLLGMLGFLGLRRRRTRA